MFPEPGDTLRVTSDMTGQVGVGTPITYRVTDIPDWPSPAGCTWLTGHIVDSVGGAGERRIILVRTDGLAPGRREPRPAMPTGTPPPDVRDLMLWRDAQAVAARHRPDPRDPTRCANPDCLDPTPYPCGSRRLADHGMLASRGIR